MTEPGAAVVRAFMALDLPEPLREGLATVQTELRERVIRRMGRQAPMPRIRWSRPETLHLTLVFLGAVRSERLSKIEAAMDRFSADEGPIRVDVAGFGGFPSNHRPRVVWVGIDNPDGRLIRFQANLAGAMTALGFELEKRPFRPHFTLARFEDPGSTRHDPRMEAVEAWFADQTAGPIWGGFLDRFILMESRPSPIGSNYSVLWERFLPGGPNES